MLRLPAIGQCQGVRARPHVPTGAAGDESFSSEKVNSVQLHTSASAVAAVLAARVVVLAGCGSGYHSDYAAPQAVARSMATASQPVRVTLRSVDARHSARRGYRRSVAAPAFRHRANRHLRLGDLRIAAYRSHRRRARSRSGRPTASATGSRTSPPRASKDLTVPAPAHRLAAAAGVDRWRNLPYLGRRRLPASSTVS